MWLSSAPNLVLAFGLIGVLFTLFFWAGTYIVTGKGQVEPSFVVLFGSMVTGSSLVNANRASKVEPIEPVKPTSPPIATPPSGEGTQA